MYHYLYIMKQTTDLLQTYGLEFIGTLLFMYMILITNQIWIVALTLIVASYFMDKKRFQYFNPAYTIMNYARKAISFNDAIVYIISQVCGALVALFLYKQF